MTSALLRRKRERQGEPASRVKQDGGKGTKAGIERVSISSNTSYRRKRVILAIIICF